MRRLRSEPCRAARAESVGHRRIGLAFFLYVFFNFVYCRCQCAIRPLSDPGIRYRERRFPIARRLPTNPSHGRSGLAVPWRESVRHGWAKSRLLSRPVGETETRLPSRASDCGTTLLCLTLNDYSMLGQPTELRNLIANKSGDNGGESVNQTSAPPFTQNNIILTSNLILCTVYFGTACSRSEISCEEPTTARSLLRCAVIINFANIISQRYQHNVISRLF